MRQLDRIIESSVFGVGLADNCQRRGVAGLEQAFHRRQRDRLVSAKP